MPAPTLSPQERDLFRQSLRRLLVNRPAHSGTNDQPRFAGPGEPLTRALAALGLYDLGHEAGSGGLAELFVAMEELGRASCPADLIASLVLRESLGCGSDHEVLRGIVDGSVTAACFVDEDRSVALAADGTLGGEIAAVELMPGTTHGVIVTPRGAVCVVPLMQPGIRLEPQIALGTMPVVTVECERATVDCRVDVEPQKLARIQSLVRGAACARALGAARAAFELVVEYTAQRRQFGKQIGAFQAVQHRLADCFITLEGIAELLAYAARLRDEDHDGWTFYLDAAFIYAAGALPQAMLDVQHTFGAMGYAEEHAAPKHFRRVHWDMLAAGGVAGARGAVRDAIASTGGLPDRPLERSAEAFRVEVREWLSANWTSQDRAQAQALPFFLRDRNPEFARKVGRMGWAALTWPSEFDGQARPVTHQLVLAEEMERAGAPRFGAPIHAAAIMAFGSPEQKAEHLERIRKGDGIYGIAYSEPDSGSDLASVRTSALETADGWVINGQKIWTTTYWGEHMWVLARTDPAAAPPHAGLSLFLMRTDTPGVTIVPADTMYGGKFANIFFDDVHLPASALLGERNQAWRILAVALPVERAVIGGGILGRVLHSFDELVAAIPDLPGQSGLAESIASFAAELAVGQALAERGARAVDEHKGGLVEAAVCKVFCSELMERFFGEALRRGGRRWALSEGSRDSVASGRFEQRLRHSLMHVISGGTNDIQRNLIAQRGLGLPRN